MWALKAPTRPFPTGQKLTLCCGLRTCTQLQLACQGAEQDRLSMRHSSEVQSSRVALEEPGSQMSQRMPVLPDEVTLYASGG